MPRQKGAKSWSESEVRLACRAYANATNTHKGCDQKQEDFIQAVVKNMERISPANAKPGTHHHRGACIYKYVRDNVFKASQKFNRSLLLVEDCQLSGVSDQEKTNIAVAHFIIGSAVMSAPYKYKDYEVTNWKFYSGWLEIRNLPKFILNNTKLGTNGRKVDQNNIIIPHVDDPQFKVGRVSLDNEDYSMGASGSMSARSRRSGMGRDATKKRMTEETSAEKEDNSKMNYRKKRDTLFFRKMDVMANGTASRAETSKRAMEILGLEKYLQIMGPSMKDEDKERIHKKLKVLAFPDSPEPPPKKDNTLPLPSSQESSNNTNQSIHQVLFGTNVKYHKTFDSSDDDAMEVLSEQVASLKRGDPPTMSRSAIKYVEVDSSAINKSLEEFPSLPKLAPGTAEAFVPINFDTLGNNEKQNKPTNKASQPTLTAPNLPRMVNNIFRPPSPSALSTGITSKSITESDGEQSGYTSNCSEGRMLELGAYWDVENAIEKQILVVMSLMKGKEKGVHISNIVSAVHLRMQYEFADDSIRQAVEGLMIDERVLQSGENTYMIMEKDSSSDSSDDE
jgi:hypothetical protein